jgi:hypothetical protein
VYDELNVNVLQLSILKDKATFSNLGTEPDFMGFGGPNERRGGRRQR